MNKRGLILCLILGTLPLEAAAPVVHVYCSDLYFNHCKPRYTQKEKDAFLRGTLFPDIRYIANIPRTKTHVKNVTLKSVQDEKDPFIAGKLFHSYVDEQREQSAQKAKIYDHLKSIPKNRKSQFLKAVEDELCYTKIVPKVAITALKTYDSHENNAGISVLIVMGWHRILQDYLKKSPLTMMKKKAQANQGYFKMTPEMVKESCTHMAKYLKDSKVKNYFSSFLKEFEAKLRK